MPKDAKKQLDAAPQQAPDLGDLPSALKVRGIAELLDVHERTVRRWIAEQRLQVIRAGGAVRIARAEFLRFLGGAA